MISWAAIIVFIAIAILPVCVMLGKSIVVDGQLSLSNYLNVFSEDRVYMLLSRSFFMAVGAMLLALVYSIPMALFLARSDFYGKNLCKYIYLVPLFIPSHIHTLAWIHLLGEKGVVNSWLMTIVGSTAPLVFLYNCYGATVLLSFSYFPVLVLMLIVGLSRIDTTQEEAALLIQSPFTVLRAVTLPLLQPYIVSGSVLVFILSFFNYGIPSMLRVNSFPVEIFTRFSAFYDEGGAAALSLPVILVAIILLYWQHRYMQNKSYASVGTSSGRQGNIFFRFGRGGCYVITLLVLTVILPLLSLLSQAGQSLSYTTALKTSAKEIFVTLALAALAATITSILAYLICRYIETGGKKLQLLELATYLPFAFPATFFGIGLIYMWNNSYSQFIYATSCILVFAYIARFIPFAIRIIAANLKQISPNMLEAAYICEPSWLKRLWYIHLPLARKGLVICWIIVFIFSMGELGATLLVIPPGMGTISLKIYTLMHYGAGALVAALAILLIAANLMVSLGMMAMTRTTRV